MKPSGFTLLEVLIALVITATSAMIILAHLRLLTDWKQRITTHQKEARAVMARLVTFFATDPTDLRPLHQGKVLGIYYKGGTHPIVLVRNYVHDDRYPVPTDRAYTPFQLYTFSPNPNGHYAVSLVLDGVKGR